MKNFFGRRNYLIQPRFQLSLAGKAFIFLLLYSAVVAFLILYPIAELITLLPVGGLTPEIKKQILSLPNYVWPLILILALVAAIQVILISHRIAGPSFRLQRAIREMSAGKYQQALRLRKHDYLKEVAESLANLCEALRRRRQSFLEHLGELRARLDRQRQHLRSSGAPSALQHDLEWMLQQMSVLERIADGAEVPGVAEPASPDPIQEPGVAGQSAAPPSRT